MKVFEKNQAFRFTEPRLAKLSSSDKWFVFLYYYILNERKEIRYSDGLNKRYFTDLSELGIKEIKKRGIERTNLANSIINHIKGWIENREFSPELKAFLLPSTEKLLVEYYDKFLEYKTSERITSGSIIQYSTKINLFKEFLSKQNVLNLKLGEVDKTLYMNYFMYLRDLNSKANWFNDILTFHRMFFKWLIEIEEVDLKSPVRVIKPMPKEEIEKHKAIPSSLISESFMQIAQFGGQILSTFAQFIFYSLHRPNSLVQLQLKDFDLSAGFVNIPSDKIKTKRSIKLKLHHKLLEMVNDFIEKNSVDANDYLFGFEYVASVRGTKKAYKLFGKNMSNTADYIQKFKHFNQNQIVSAYKQDDGLVKIFKYGENTLYGYKHTGIVFLRENGWTLEQILQLTGHNDTEIVKWYGRDFKPSIPDFIDIK